MCTNLSRYVANEDIKALDMYIDKLIKLKDDSFTYCNKKYTKELFVTPDYKFLITIFIP